MHDLAGYRRKHHVAFPLRTLVAATMLVLAAGSTAFAQSGGLTFPEQGGPISGTAQAGQAAIARDASTSWLNPAGLVRLEKAEFLAGTQLIRLQAEFDPRSGTTTGGNDGGDAGDWLLGGSMYLAVPVHDDVTLGLSVTAPYGIPLDYRDGWVGRYYATEVELLTINIEPAVGVRLTDWLSAGAGIDFQYASFEQKTSVPLPARDRSVTIDGDNWEVGVTLGLLAELGERTRIGLRYRSEMDHDLTGDLKTIGTQKTSAGLTLPHSLTLSAYHELNETWALMADLGWTNWSSFDRTIINITGTQIEADIPREWKDTWNVGFGAHYRLNDAWLLMSGVSWVSSAVNPSNRTPDLPVDQQWRFALGVEYKASDRVTWGANYTLANLGRNKLDTTNVGGRVVGDYDAFLHILGIYGSFSF